MSNPWLRQCRCALSVVNGRDKEGTIFMKMEGYSSVLRLPLCLVMRRDKNFDWFTRVTWEGARTKSHDFVKISSWGN